MKRKIRGMFELEGILMAAWWLGILLLGFLAALVIPPLLEFFGH